MDTILAQDYGHPGKAVPPESSRNLCSWYILRLARSMLLPDPSPLPALAVSLQLRSSIPFKHG